MLTIYELLSNARTELKSKLETTNHNSLDICNLVSELSQKHGSIYRDRIHDFCAYDELYNDEPEL